MGQSDSLTSVLMSTAVILAVYTAGMRLVDVEMAPVLCLCATLFLFGYLLFR
jgi:hypothetical protein